MTTNGPNSGTGHAIDTLYLEQRRYEPPAAFAKQANAQPEIYEKSFDWRRFVTEVMPVFERLQSNRV